MRCQDNNARQEALEKTWREILSEIEWNVNNEDMIYSVKWPTLGRGYTTRSTNATQKRKKN